jgi:hypothetical protein
MAPDECETVFIPIAKTGPVWRRGKSSLPIRLEPVIPEAPEGTFIGPAFSEVNWSPESGGPHIGHFFVAEIRIDPGSMVVCNMESSGGRKTSEMRLEGLWVT